MSKENVSKEQKGYDVNHLLVAGWTPVWKSLPDINECVIILTDYGKCDVCRLGINEDLRTITWINDMRPQHSNGSVVAWRKLPEIPACN